jgi:perosamine synthetase
MIRLTKPELSGALEGVGRLLDEGFLVQGERVREFEASVAAYVGRKHALAVSSGTAAIHCALMAVGIGPGDEVAVPDFTFPATANAVVHAGARPVLVDIDPGTFNISPDALEAHLGGRVRAVMPVDLFGLAADLDGIGETCRRHNLILIEDSACGLGARLEGKKCGAFGEASVFSFHPRKLVTTGEGGMVLTDDDEVARRVGELRNHGIRVSADGAEFVTAGFNYRMTEIAAVLGLAQMKRIGTLLERRRRIAAAYAGLLEDLDGVVTPCECRGCYHAYQAYVIMLDDELDRDLVVRLLRARGVESTIGTYAIHAQPYYMNMLGHKPGDYPVSLRAMRQSLALPLYPSMTEVDVAKVAGALADAVAEASAGK